ncbi:STAS/SEC14 domain-containing protein [Pyxidicoccus fallax]|uniref:STAS/SEC14 domain-containing protein n=1 Tax=Pyxidicoccus fallax TaxID=394095 RepID=A0A848LIY8_9BACT|nr:STAS/SEC14 domain-containing protein [Pyxidicoccus fallax]NMO17658.1 STAS/SEC14 domain-containing protein [Pyxidicoccus fallax]NPC78654.1 STAS/SEC14 domain-containing protein [Pyxidicoccus fallax]
MGARKEWKFGAHVARLEQSDVLVVSFSGPTSFDEARRSVEICEELGSLQPFYLVMDVSDSTIDTKSREYISRNLKAEWFHGILYVGLGLAQRAMAKAILLALYFTGKWSVEVDFVPTEQAAHALILRRREQRLAHAA